MDEEKETLQQRIRELEKKLDLAEKALEVKELLAPMRSLGTRALKKTEGSARSDRKIMEIIEEMKDRTRMPYKMICKALQLPVGSFNRWRHRIQENLV